MGRILVTPRSLTASPHPAVERLREHGHEIIYCEPGKLPSEQELLPLVADVIGWLAGIESVSEAVIAAARQLRVISRNGVGVDNLPLLALAEHGIVLRIAEGANALGVAELTIALMLSAMRHIPLADSGIKAGQWPRHIGREIRGRTVGVIGYGAIGREVARLVDALGAIALVCDPALRAAPVPSRVRQVDLDTLVAESDVVTLHCPASDDGLPLLGASQFARCRRGVILVNTARASLVDERALAEALNSGHAASYAVDVFNEEPPRELTLAGDRHVIATSHIGGFTRESVERATRVAVANLLDSLASIAP
jgi:D-3-phosphoglycerate dehydrogenase / 2-oxoglutarate reductase